MNREIFLRNTAIFNLENAVAQSVETLSKQKKYAALDQGLMQKLLRYFACFILLISGMIINPIYASCAQENPTANIKADDTYAFDFVLKDLNGKNIKLSDYKGKMVLLYFMTTWCPECLSSIPYLKGLHSRYSEKGLIILNIDIQETEGKATAYTKKHRLPYATLLDQDGTIAKRYSVVGVPAKALIDRNGRLICWECRSLDKLLESNLK